MDTLGVLTVSERQLMLRSLKRAGACSSFAAIYSTFTPLEIFEVHFDCTGSVNLGVGSDDCALVVAPRAFSHMVVTFRGRRKGNLVFWCFKADLS